MQGENTESMKRNVVKVLNLLLMLSLLWNNVKAVDFYKKDDILTDSVVLYNVDLDKEVYSKNPNKRMSMASTTKIMTYIIVAENISDFDNINVVVSSDVFSGLEDDVAVAGLRDGDIFNINELLNCLMVPSGGDAALVLANYVGGGSTDRFVEMMNNKAVELGCSDTHFVNPHGLHDEMHYSTANDMYKISRYAMKQQRFMEICNKTEYNPFSDDRKPLITTNKMIDKTRGGKYYYKYACGIKTGYHNQAGNCLVSTATKDGMTYMCVALGGPSVDADGNKLEYNMAMLESKKLYEWAFESLKLQPLSDMKKTIGETKLDLAWKKDNLLLFTEKSVYTILPSKFNMEDIKVEMNVPDMVDAPVEVGDIVGGAKFLYEGEILAESNVVSGEIVPMSFVLLTVRTIKNILLSKVFLVCFTMFMFLAAFYIFITVRKNRLRKNRRRKIIKKYNDRPKK